MQATTLDWSLRPALLGGNSAAIVPRVTARDRIARSTLRGGELAVAPSRPPPRARGARRSSREQIGEAAPDFFSPWPSPGESASICCHDERRAEEAGVRGDRPPRDGDRRARRADPQAPGDGIQGSEDRRARAGDARPPGHDPAYRARHDRRARGGAWARRRRPDVRADRRAGRPARDRAPRGRSGDRRRARLRAQCADRGHARRGDGPLRRGGVRAPRRPRGLLRGARRRGRRHRVAPGADSGRSARVPVRQAGADAPRPLRRRGPRDDDPYQLAGGGRQGGSPRVEQRPGGQDRALRRAGRTWG